MRTFDYSKLNFTFDNEVMGFVARSYEYKDRQQLFVSQKKRSQKNWLRQQKDGVQKFPTKLKKSFLQNSESDSQFKKLLLKIMMKKKPQDTEISSISFMKTLNTFLLLQVIFSGYISISISMQILPLVAISKIYRIILLSIFLMELQKSSLSP